MTPRRDAMTSTPARARRLQGKTMRTVMIAAIATMLASTSGFGQSIVPSGAGTPTPPERPSTTASKQEHARATTSKTTAASPPESRRRVGALARADLPAHRHFQSALERQRHGLKSVGGVVEKREVVRIVAAMELRVVADDDGAAAKMRRDQLQRRARHTDPDVDQQEIDRLVDAQQRLAQIALPKLDMAAEPGTLEMRGRSSCLLRLTLGADDEATAAPLSDVVAQCCRQIERRNAVGRADLDDAPCIGGAAELIAELGLVAIKRDQLVADELLDLLRSRCPAFAASLRKRAQGRKLRIATAMELREQARQGWILNELTLSSLRWHDPDRFGGYDLSLHDADTPGRKQRSRKWR